LKTKHRSKKRGAANAPLWLISHLFSHLFIHGRKGFALPLALIIAIVGAILSGAIIQRGYSFFRSMGRQRSFYGDHVSVTDYVQAVKGQLIQANIERGASGDGVWHGQGLNDELASEIHSVADLLLNDARFSFDVSLGSIGQGRQRVRVNVFDVHYQENQLQNSLRNDPGQMSVLPAPINALMGKSTNSSSGQGGAEGEAEDPTKGTQSEAASGELHYPWDRFGAYVVKVELFDVDGLNQPTLKRTAEEAFFQVLRPAP
jgi:hypothetical protein